MSEQSLLQRLKERKLVQWAVAYLAGAWVLVEATGHVVGLFQWPIVVTEVVTILAFFGFFVVLVIAWYHGEQGRQWVSGPELLIIALLLLISGGVLSMLGDGEDALEAPATPAFVPAESEKPAIAVLPFDNFSPNPDDAYFADGIHDEILSKLSGISSLRVTSRSSVEQYREGRPPIPQIAATLDVEYVLEGSARIAGGTVRMIVQLIQGQTDEHLWAGEFDREYSVENLIDIQSGIAQEVTSQLAVRITPEEEDRIEALPTESLDAYEAYLLGRYHVGRWEDLSAGASEAARYYQIAIQQDPDLAPAHLGLAGAYYLMLSIGDRAPRETWPQVEGWARSALAIDSSLALAHAVLAELQLVRTWDWEEAERAMERAIELSPSDPLAHNLYSKVLMAQGKINEALREANTVAELDPLASSTLSLRARWTFYSRRYEEAEQLAGIFLTRDPENGAAAWHLAHSFSFGGHPEDMIRLFPNWIADSARITARLGARWAQLLSLAGEADSAKVVIDQALSNPRDEYIDPDHVWPVYALLGDVDQALFWMERSVEDQSSSAREIGVIPLADPLRDDPRYQALLDRIGLGHLKARFDSLAAADPRGGT